MGKALSSISDGFKEERERCKIHKNLSNQEVCLVEEICALKYGA